MRAANDRVRAQIGGWGNVRGVGSERARVAKACALLLAVLGGTLGAACHTADGESLRTPSGGPVSCTSDADCVVTSFAGCCGCCPSSPRAIPVTTLSAQRKQCSVVECSPCSSRISCADVEPVARFVARCREGTCAAVHE